jgi:hypothetical protein
VPSQPNVFYAGFDNGGVWRSTDYGSNWEPIFDQRGTGSIGAIAVAPSDPNVIYVGTGAASFVRISRRATASTSRPTAERLDAPRSPRSQMIAMIDVDPTTRTGSSSPRSDIRTGRMPSEEFPLDRRRPVVSKSLVQGRIHERQRRAHRSVERQHRLCESLAAAAELHRRQAFGGPGTGIYKSIDGGTTWSS